MLQYLIRLDDLCPTNNLEKWQRFFRLFDRYKIKPIIAVIPDNQDPKLTSHGNYNFNYWWLVRELQSKGYIMGMHGYDHCYVNQNSGILKMNKRSEFAGLPSSIQEQKIKAAASIFKRENIHASLFVAPAHTFDRNTLMALQRHTNIRVISDGLLKSPYIRFGFNWIPVQLSEVEPKTENTWTFNYHPETCTDRAFYELEDFIAKHHRHFVSLHDLSFVNYTWKDYLLEKFYIHKRLFRSYVDLLIKVLEKIPT
jgi:predicted deacetylase